MGALSEYSGLVKVHLLCLRWAAEAKQKGTDGVGVSDALAPSVTVNGLQETVTGIVAPVSVSTIGKGGV